MYFGTSYRLTILYHDAALTLLCHKYLLKMSLKRSKPLKSKVFILVSSLLLLFYILSIYFNVFNVSMEFVMPYTLNAHVELLFRY